MTYYREVRAFYKDRPSVCAFHVWVTAPHAFDCEIAAAKSRNDIGRIETRERNGQWTCVP